MHNRLEPDQIYVAVDAMILTENGGRLKLLLSRRPHEPCLHKWALPGRFIARDESAEAAVEKLLAEMLPVQAAYSEQLYTFTHPARDARGRILSIAYLVIVPWQQLEPVLHADTALRCFTVETALPGCPITDEEGLPLPLEDLAFDHGAIIRTGVARLQGKIDYTDIGFRFLNTPGAFSLSELQRIFEAVQGKAQDASNFRRFVRGRYEETKCISPLERAEKKGRGRPAVLYSWNR